MKAVQVGILVALVVVAGLLYMNLRKDAQPPQVAPASQVAQAPATPEAAPAPPADVTQPAPPAAAPSPEPVRKAYKNSPLPPAKKVVKSYGAADATLKPADPSTDHFDAPAPPPAAASQQAPRPPEPNANFKPMNPETPITTASSGPAARQPRTIAIPAGTTLNVRLTEGLDSDKNKVGDSFRATLDSSIIIDGLVIADRGARVEGRVVDSKKAGRVKGLSNLAVALTSLETDDGQNVKINTATFEKEGPSGVKGDAAKVGIASGIGAAIGAIAGGGKGAAIGAGVGGAAGAGGVMATRGKPAVLPSETRLTFSLSEPVTITEKLK